MSSGVFFTSLVSFIVFASAFVAGISIFLKRKKNNELLNTYGIFLLLSSGLWFFVGLNLFFAWLGMETLSKSFFVVDQIFLFSSGPPLIYYLALKISKSKKIAKIATCFLSFFIGLAIYFLFVNGVSQEAATYFVIKFKPNSLSFLFFLIVLIPLLIASSFDAVFRLFKILFFKRKGKDEIYDFFYSLVIAAYLLLGLFDEQGSIVSWRLVIFRLLFAASFLLAYLTFYSQQARDEQYLERFHEKTK